MATPAASARLGPRRAAVPRRHVPHLALTASVLVAGCAQAIGSGALGSSSGPEVPRDVVPVVWSATDVLERYRIPVAVADEDEGRVESGTFRVHRMWDRFTAEQIVECPNFGSIRPTDLYAMPFDVQVVVHAHDTGATTTQIRVAGTAESTGPGNAAGQRIRCVVAEGFRGFLAEEIRRDVMNLPPRHPAAYPQR